MPSVFDSLVSPAAVGVGIQKSFEEGQVRGGLRTPEYQADMRRRGYKPASTRLTPSADSSQVTLTLQRRAPRPSSDSSSHSTSELKIPDAFSRQR